MAKPPPLPEDPPESPPPVLVVTFGFDSVLSPLRAGSDVMRLDRVLGHYGRAMRGWTAVSKTAGRVQWTESVRWHTVAKTAWVTNPEGRARIRARNRAMMDRRVVETYLVELHERLKGLRSGEVAKYIPELAKASPDAFGICIATVDGRVHEVGDSAHPFTIQSISKPLVYGLALDTVGEEKVRRKVGVEPTGEAFNSIRLEPETGRPLNPMINAGAIATTALVPGATASERLNCLLEVFGRYVGHPVSVDEQVFRSESETGHRNRAIGHLLRNFEILEEHPDSALELYFKQCSISVTCRDLAVIAATLAAGGTNPFTGEVAVQSRCIPRILSVMTFAGMYDFAGGWGYRVGLPAKSGVGGGVLAVLPGQLGIGVYSPPLDEKGNSTRGVRVCEELSERFGLHFLNAARTPPPIRASLDGTRIASKRRRRAKLEAFLHQHGARIRLFELQGQLRFSTVEVVIAEVEAALADAHYFILDFQHVLDIDASGEELFSRLADAVSAAGKQLLLSSVAAFPEFSARFAAFQDRDLALEWCENGLGSSHGFELGPARRVAVSETDLLAGASPAEVEYLTSRLTSRHFPTGAFILRQGDPADGIFFLVRGDVSVIADGAHAQSRLTTLSAGTTFGELAVLDEGPRSAHVRAETEVVCLWLALDEFERLADTHPRLQAQLLKNMLHSATRTARRLTSDVMAR